MPRGSRTAVVTYSPAWGRCRFCGKSSPQSEMVKYGVRHHAHAVCLYHNRGIEALDALHTWQLRHLPLLALMEAGVTLAQARVWLDRISDEYDKFAARASAMNYVHDVPLEALVDDPPE